MGVSNDVEGGRRKGWGEKEKGVERGGEGSGVGRGGGGGRLQQQCILQGNGRYRGQAPGQHTRSMPTNID